MQSACTLASLILPADQYHCPALRFRITLRIDAYQNEQKNTAMATKIRRVDYFYATIKDQPGQAYLFLQQLADLGINLLAFTAVPVGPYSTQLSIFPENAKNLTDLARHAGLKIEGPHHAILVQGNDEVGALADVHKQIYQAGVNIYASTGIATDKETYGYLLYIRPEAYERAAQALGL